MNAVAIMYVNDHLESLRAEARQRRAASPTRKRSLRDRIASLASGLRSTLGFEAAGTTVPTVKNYPYGG